MLVLVTYDVSTETARGRRRLRRVAKICEGFGQRVQKSVFECTVNATHFEALKQRLVNAIDEGQDSLRLYRLPERRSDIVEEYGVTEVKDFTGPLVI